MSQVCTCDICGKITHLNPPTELEYEEVTIDGVACQRMKTAQIKSMNPFTKEIEIKEVPKHRDLKPRAYIISIHIGMSEYIQRDFCFECLQKVKPDVLKAWDLLEGIKPQ